MMAGLAHDTEVAARFNAAAGRFKHSIPVDDARLQAVKRALGPLDGLRLLDLGCGKGRFATRLVERGAEAVGIDLSATMLAQANGINRVRGSARRLPFADETFDAVVAIEVLEHVGDIDSVLAEVRRVLRPGGRLAIIDKNALALDACRPWLPAVVVKWIDQHRGLWMYPKQSPVRERWFVPHFLNRSIRLQGFDSARVEFILTPREQTHWLHRAIPMARLMTLWSAQAGVRP